MGKFLGPILEGDGSVGGLRFRGSIMISGPGTLTLFLSAFPFLAFPPMCFLLGVSFLVFPSWCFLLGVSVLVFPF